jgi:hypothetical protein
MFIRRLPDHVQLAIEQGGAATANTSSSCGVLPHLDITNREEQP